MTTVIDPDPRVWPNAGPHAHLQFLADMYRELPDDTRITVPLDLVRTLATGSDAAPHPARETVIRALTAAAAEQIPRPTGRQITRAADLVCDALQHDVDEGLADHPDATGGPKETAAELGPRPEVPTGIGDPSTVDLRAQVAVVERYAEATYTRARTLRGEDLPVAAAELETAAFGMVSAADALRPLAGMAPPRYRGPVLVHACFLMYGFRYALGRRTHAPSDVAAALIEHKHHLLPEWRVQIAADIGEAIACGRAGSDHDVALWTRVADALVSGTADA